MLRSVLISAAVAVVFGLSMRLFAHGREKEADASGRPVMRYLAAPYMMASVGAAFLAVAVYQWFDPFNHRHPGNLFWLSFLPGAFGLSALACAVYYRTFRATLTRDAIEVVGWPLRRKAYRLADVEKIAEGDPCDVVHFSGNRKFKIYASYSGRKHFIQALRTAIS